MFFSFLLNQETFDDGFVLPFYTRAPVAYLEINGDKYTSTQTLYDGGGDVVVKDIKCVTSDDTEIDQLFNGVSFFSPVAQNNGPSILYVDGDQLLHPYLVLKFKGHDENFELPDEYKNKYKYLWECDTSYDPFVQTVEIIKPFKDMDYSSRQWHNWYSEIGYDQNIITMRRVLSVYQEKIKKLKARVCFVGDGYGVGCVVAREYGINSVSTEIDPFSRYIGKDRNKVNYVDMYEPDDILIYLHVDESLEWKFVNRVVCIGYHLEKYGGNSGVYCNFDRSIAVRIEGDLYGRPTSSGVIYVTLHNEFIDLEDRRPFYLIKDRSMIYSKTILEDFNSKILYVQKDVNHYIMSSVRYKDLVVYRKYNDGTVFLYKFKLRKNYWYEYFVGDERRYVVGADHNSIALYGNYFSSDNEYDGSNGDFTICNPFNHLCDKNCLDLLVFNDGVLKHVYQTPQQSAHMRRERRKDRVGDESDFDEIFEEKQLDVPIVSSVSILVSDFIDPLDRSHKEDLYICESKLDVESFEKSIKEDGDSKLDGELSYNEKTIIEHAIVDLKADIAKNLEELAIMDERRLRRSKIAIVNVKAEIAKNIEELAIVEEQESLRRSKIVPHDGPKKNNEKKRKKV